MQSERLTYIADQSLEVSYLTHSETRVLNIDLPTESNCPILPVEVNGWTIDGELKCDYYSWVSKFTATKGDMVVEGDANDIIRATSEEAYNLFLDEIGLSSFDTYDI